MTIQISVIIWTLICFALLYFILKYLLITPVLKVMDDRNEKFEKAKNDKIKREEDEKALREKLEAERAEAEEKMRREISDEAEKVRSDTKRMLEEAKALNAAETDAFKRTAEAEYEKGANEVTSCMSKIADEFISNLFAE